MGKVFRIIDTVIAVMEIIVSTKDDIEAFRKARQERRAKKREATK